MYRIFRSLIIGLLLVSFWPQLFAQTPPPLCGTPDLTPRQARSLIQLGNLALAQKQTSGAATNALTYVPIRPHIIRRSNGSGGLSLADLNQIIATTNSYFLYNNYGIQFYFAGTSPNYINADDLFTAFPYPEGSAVDGQDATNALNQYYVSGFNNSGVGGFARYPANDIASTRSFIQIGGSLDDVGSRLIPHELGHTFGLFHTFGFNSGNGTLGSGVTTELVTRGSGANCTTDGDWICDTPADPYGISGTSLTYQKGCPQYDPTSTARDANGEAYSPSITNIMSYYYPCIHDFTPGQYERIQQGLAARQTHTAYSLNAPPTNAAAPSNLQISLNGAIATLSWQDNATNEMGYFIERSTSPSTGFVAVGGVGPNTTSFVESKPLPSGHYYYRIRPSNTTTGSISTVADVTLSGPGLSTTIIGTYALFSWLPAGENVSYELQWRPVNSPTWTTVSNLSQTTYSLNGLASNTTYEWRLKTIGSEQYAGPVTFTIPCQQPGYLSASSTRVSAYLSWNTVPNQTYTLRWRAVGEPAWTTGNNLGVGTSSYSLTGLKPATAYEWQIQATCSSEVATDFTAIQTFSTYSCIPPSALGSGTARSSSIYLYWSNSYYEPERTTELRYRAVGTSSWTVVSGLTETQYTPTGLTNNTQYEWQVMNRCPGGEQSDYSPSGLFTTQCSVPTGLYSKTTTTTARLSWYITGVEESGRLFDLQYRVSGTPNWTIISGLSTSYYTLTGLATNVLYEWRVSQICSAAAQSVYSTTASFVPRCNPVETYNAYASLVTSSSAQFFWLAENEAGTSYEIRYRPVGSSDWTTVSSLTATTSSGTFDINNLTNNVTYEWQIRTSCSAQISSSYTTGPSFTTQCQIPDGLYTYILTAKGASLSWNTKGKGVTYNLRYRRAGTTDWTVLNNLVTTNAALSNLPAGTGYEWQVQTRCPADQYSSFSNIASFKTLPCNSPVAGWTGSTDSSSSFSWSVYGGDGNTRVELRYRVTGTTDWLTRTDLVTASNGNGYYTLTGLASSTQYEWQMRSMCSATESSLFTTTYTFQTKARCTAMYTLRSGSWNDISVWSCGRVPTSVDNVTIGPAHTVLLDTGMPTAVCQNLEILGTFSMQGSAITVNGVRIVIDQENVTTK